MLFSLSHCPSPNLPSSAAPSRSLTHSSGVVAYRLKRPHLVHDHNNNHILMVGGKLALWDRRVAEGHQWRWIDKLPENGNSRYRGFVLKGRLNVVP